ncbi:Hsp70-binding protein 1 [Trichoplax sp. H2]|nr:Hsp70-binding protein 1 [Trichoplax sp. H2]|eukprot:RDD44796.1 Hsp70-binding protein 1 [Trichoplax sp. H2]
MADRSRRRINIEGVLRFALEHQDAPAAGGEIAYQPISEDRRTWLRAALDFLSSAESEIDRLKACTEVLKKSEMKRKERNIDTYADSDEDKKLVLNALEEIIEIIDQIDNARDFCTIGGLKYVVNLIEEIKNNDIIIASCNVIATVTQNNPSCQDFAIRCKVIQPLLNLLQNSDVTEVKVKCVYALSGLIREHIKAQESFAENDGYSIIVRSLQVKAPKLRIKIAFLCKALCAHQPEIKDILLRVGFVDHLAVILQEPHNSYHEHVLSALVAITDNCAPAVEACRQSHLEFEKSLRSIKDQILSSPELRDSQQEELQYCEKLLTCCFDSDTLAVGER